MIIFTHNVSITFMVNYAGDNMNNDTVGQGFSRQESRAKLLNLLGDETLKTLSARSNLKGSWAVASCWMTIVAAMIAFAWAQSLPLSMALPVMALALVIIAGRQLGLSILMHEASHRALFKHEWLNDTLADWLCGRPIFIDVAKYRKHHMIHHRETGTSDDIDYSLVKKFPTSRASLFRKFARDLLGITGIKSLIGLSLMNAGLLKWTVANNIQRLPKNNQHIGHYIQTFFKNAWPTLIFNGALFLSTLAVGHTEMFLAWVIAYLSPYQLFIRIRSIAEHAMTEQSPDMLKNTRTTKASWIARALVAPFNVNFHIEHHAMPTASFWQLPRLHRLLREKGVTPESPSYFQVLKMVSSR
jgi:fatty acid desaturase